MLSTSRPPSGADRGAARPRVVRRRRSRATRQRRLTAIGFLALVVAAGGLIVALVTGGGRSQPHLGRGLAHTSRVASNTNPPPRPPSSFAVGLRVLQLVDPSRTIHLPDGSVEPRTLRTYVRYPALGPAGGTDLRNAPAARIDGPFPLVIFGHGFAVTPGLYAHLLQTWTHAGYVVAAPVFPLGNANAPGGPNESDLVNQPADMRFVISQLLATSSDASGPLAGLIDSDRHVLDHQCSQPRFHRVQQHRSNPLSAQLRYETRLWPRASRALNMRAGSGLRSTSIEHRARPVTGSGPSAALGSSRQAISTGATPQTGRLRTG